MSLGTINGVAVISATRVPWKPDDDGAVVNVCESRGLVLFDGGGKSDAVIVEGQAIIWERQGERFRSFPVPVLSSRAELLDIAQRLRRIGLRFGEEDRNTLALLLHVGGVLNATAGRLPL